VQGDYLRKNDTGEVELITEKQWKDAVAVYGSIIRIITDYNSGIIHLSYKEYQQMPMIFFQALRVYNKFAKQEKKSDD
jgi:hypothetical protein